MNNEKKIAVLVGDGMADYPIEELSHKTPLQVAKTTNMDYLAKYGLFGLTKTIFDDLHPGSDVANMSIFGYNPKLYYTGRAPLEALNMNIDLNENDVAFRCNLVTIKDNIMVDFSANHIESEFSRYIIELINKVIQIENVEFYPGVSYRNIMVIRDYKGAIPDTTPPHDIHNKNVLEYLPRGNNSDLLIDIMKKASAEIKSSKYINELKSKYNGNPTDIWLWGGGFKPKFDLIKEKYGLNGVTISAVDLIHGIGKGLGLTPIDVDGATGYIDTNYNGKAKALLDAMENHNFVYLHVEAPDEAGHQGNVEHKIKAIEDFDKYIVGTVVNKLNKFNDYTILVMPDHPTPIKIRTHTNDPVPFVIYSPSKNIINNVNGYDEFEAKKTNVFVEYAHELMKYIVDDNFETLLNK